VWEEINGQIDRLMGSDRQSEKERRFVRQRERQRRRESGKSAR